MITETDIVLTIGCPVAPESFEATFRLRYDAAYLEDGKPKQAAFEKDYRVHKDQCYFVRFSEGSVVQFGHIPLFSAWTNALKRRLAHYEVESYWGYHVCDVMPTMGYSSGHTWPKPNQGYCGNELRCEFEVPITEIHVASSYFGRTGGFSTYKIEAKEK